MQVYANETAQKRQYVVKIGNLFEVIVYTPNRTKEAANWNVDRFKGLTSRQAADKLIETR